METIKPYLSDYEYFEDEIIIIALAIMNELNANDVHIGYKTICHIVDVDEDRGCLDVEVTIEILHISYIYEIANHYNLQLMQDRFYILYDELYFAHKGYLIKVY